MTAHELVAAYVRRTCPDADVLLEILGVTVGGVMQPDDERANEVGRTLMQVREATKIERPIEMDKQPKVSTAPDALRNLPPVVVAPKPEVKRGHRATNPGRKYSPRKTQIGSPAQIAAAQATARGRFAPCGKYGAYRRHLRHGEPIDEACAEAARVQWRERDKTRVRGNRNAA